jgi:hypothetical protein
MIGPHAQGGRPLCAEQWRREVERCHREIAETERLLRAGHPDVQGLCLALSDWSAELRILESLPWKSKFFNF